MNIKKNQKVKASNNADHRSDRRIGVTNQRYKGYMIRLDRGGDGYNVYDKYGELEDAGYSSLESAKKLVDELVAENKKYRVNAANEYDSDNSDWTELKSKSVLDSDGFNTDYTLYTNGETYICMFGDKDLYEPDASYADYETESEQDAWNWFNSYTGFADEEDEYDDILQSTEVINSSYSPDLLNDLVNYYRPFDTMSSEEIWDEIVAEYNNEDLANDVLESLDHEEDVDLADEEGAYDVYSSSDIKASMGRYDEYYGQTAAATYGDLIADRLKGKSVSKRRDTANEPGGLIYEADKLGIDMWDLLEALEGMCNEGRAREMDDSTYKILGASSVPLHEVNSNCNVYSSEDFEDHEDDIDIIII